MRAIEYGLITALIAVVVITGLSVAGLMGKPIPVAFAMSAGGTTTTYGKTIHGIICLADGRAWAARSNGMCTIVDRPK